MFAQGKGSPGRWWSSDKADWKSGVAIDRRNRTHTKEAFIDAKVQVPPA